MAKGKYQQWLKPESLAQIENWAAKGLTYEEIAGNIGVTETTLYNWINKHVEILEAIKKGRQESIIAIENKAFQCAMGEVTEEVITKFREKDGSETAKIMKRKLSPSIPMLIFLLKNRAGYSDNPSQNTAEKQDEEIMSFIKGLKFGKSI